MLEELRLRGLGVLEDATLELGPGFTAITGETGAGKTMLLSGLSLLFGGRADAALVRAGHDRAEVDGRIAVADEHPAVARVREAGGDLDEGVLLLSRTVASEGRSRAFAGGRAVPVGVLSDLADDLLAVHGQADQRGLLRPSVQRTALDRFGGEAVASALARYRAGFADMTGLSAQLHELTTRRRERAQEADLLRLGLAEVEAVRPAADEDVTLRAQVDRLSHIDRLKRAAEQAHVALSAPETVDVADALTLVAAARRALEEIQGIDAVLDALAARLADVSYQLSDLSADLAAYVATIEDDPARLAAAQQRLADLAALTRKYAPDVTGVIAWAEKAASRLAELEDDDGLVQRLNAQVEAATAELAEAAGALSALRRATAREFESAVNAELAALAMPNARIQVVVQQRDDARGLAVGDGRRIAFGPHGADEVEILLVAHANAPARPLHRGASGGELSRIMLAVEVVLAGGDAVPTFVFDEVDAGVGGRSAIEVGRRLAALATTAQVIVVTHLPQVAAFADRHLVVDKTVDGGGGTTVVRRVEGEARLAELARMLGGLDDSATGRDHAEELLDVAARARGGA